MHRDQHEDWVMNFLKCGMFSGGQEVVLKTIHLVKELEVNEWLLKKDKMESVIMGLKRHPEMSKQLLDFMIGVLGEGFIEFIRVEFQDKFSHQQ
jgi:hypothetical protein